MGAGDAVVCLESLSPPMVCSRPPLPEAQVPSHGQVTAPVPASADGARNAGKATHSPVLMHCSTPQPTQEALTNHNLSKTETVKPDTPQTERGPAADTLEKAPRVDSDPHAHLANPSPVHTHWHTAQPTHEALSNHNLREPETVKLDTPQPESGPAADTPTAAPRADKRDAPTTRGATSASAYIRTQQERSARCDAFRVITLGGTVKIVKKKLCVALTHHRGWCGHAQTHLYCSC